MSPIASIPGRAGAPAGTPSPRGRGRWLVEVAAVLAGVNRSWSVSPPVCAPDPRRPSGRSGERDSVGHVESCRPRRRKDVRERGTCTCSINWPMPGDERRESLCRPGPHLEQLGRRVSRRARRHAPRFGPVALVDAPRSRSSVNQIRFRLDLPGEAVVRLERHDPSPESISSTGVHCRGPNAPDHVFHGPMWCVVSPMAVDCAPSVRPPSSRTTCASEVLPRVAVEDDEIGVVAGDERAGGGARHPAIHAGRDNRWRGTPSSTVRHCSPCPCVAGPSIPSGATTRAGFPASGSSSSIGGVPEPFANDGARHEQRLETRRRPSVLARPEAVGEDRGRMERARNCTEPRDIPSSAKRGRSSGREQLANARCGVGDRAAPTPPSSLRRRRAPRGFGAGRRSHGRRPGSRPRRRSRTIFCELRGRSWICTPAAVEQSTPSCEPSVPSMNTLEIPRCGASGPPSPGAYKPTAAAASTRSAGIDCHTRSGEADPRSSSLRHRRRATEPAVLCRAPT